MFLKQKNIFKIWDDYPLFLLDTGVDEDVAECVEFSEVIESDRVKLLDEPESDFVLSFSFLNITTSKTNKRNSKLKICKNKKYKTGFWSVTECVFGVYDVNFSHWISTSVNVNVPT